MASKRVADILISRGAPFTAAQIELLSDADGWRWIYANDQQAQQDKFAARLPEICFTGFGPDDKARLIEAGLKAGFNVKDAVTKNLRILVTGANAGPSKIKKATAQNCIITDEEGFWDYLKSQA